MLTEVLNEAGAEHPELLAQVSGVERMMLGSAIRVAVCSMLEVTPS